MNNMGGFAAGTLVHTDKGLVPIEQIKVGDLVLSKSEDGIRAQVYKSVVRTIATENVDVCLIKCIRKEILDDPSRKFVKPIEDEELTNIVVTSNRQFWVVGKGWIQAEDLRDKDLFEVAIGTTASVFGGGGEFTSARPIYHIPGDSSGWILRFNEYGDDEGVILKDFDLTPSVMRERNTGVPYRDAYLGWYKDHNQRYSCTVYNFEVAGTHNYCVADLGVWVHDA